MSSAAGSDGAGERSPARRTVSRLLAGVIAGTGVVFFGSLSIALVGGFLPPLWAQIVFSSWTPGLRALWNQQLREVFAVGGAVQEQSGLAFGGLLVLSAVIAIVGISTRRKKADDLGSRLIVLVAASLTCALLAALFAGLSGSYDGHLTSSHSPLIFFASAAVLTFVLGAFSFGVVSRLRAPLPVVLWRAALLVGVVFVVGGVALPVFAAWDSTTPGAAGAHLAQASPFSAAAGGLVIPLALQAPVSMEKDYVDPFFVAADSLGVGRRQPVRAPALIAALDRRPAGRLYQYAAAEGPAGTVVGVLITLAVLAALAAAAVSACRRQRPAGAAAALRLGLLQGGAVVVLLVPLAALSAFRGRSTEYRPPVQTFWGASAASLVYTAAVVLAVCAAAALAWSWTAARRTAPSETEPPRV